MIDHDAIFKRLLTTFFVEFLELFAPDVLALLDRERITFLDKESFANLVDPDRREADLVVQAQMREHPAYIIVHLEHQAQADSVIDRRMFRYFSRLYDQYDVPIYPIVLCSYPTPRTPAADRHQVTFPHRTVLDFRYQVVQLNRLDWHTYARNPNPLATALMARMRIANQDRVRVKLECLKLLTGKALEPARKQMIGGFIDTYLPLNPSEERQLQQELQTLLPTEREAVMVLMTQWERKGREEGKRELVMRQLTRKLGSLPANLEARIATLPTEHLELLGEALLDFTTVDELVAWLDHPPAAPGV